jgi:hypothetical protein
VENFVCIYVREILHRIIIDDPRDSSSRIVIKSVRMRNYPSLYIEIKVDTSCRLIEYSRSIVTNGISVILSGQVTEQSGNLQIFSNIDSPFLPV